MDGSLGAQITDAFERERLHPKSPTSREEIPFTYEAIGDAWLTDVICRDVPGAMVVSHRLGPPDEGTNNRRRIHLSYNAAGEAAGLPKSVFCKATQGLANRLMLGHSGGVLCEVTFHNHVRPLLDIEAPRCLLARFDPVGFGSIVVLEDLQGKAEFCSEDTKADRTFVEAQLSLLARLHARFYQARELDETLSVLPTWYERFNNLAGFHLKEACAAGIEAGRDLLSPALFARREEIWPTTMKAQEAIRAQPLTLCHGDVHLKNWYVLNDGTIGLGDWGVTHRGHWSRDVCYTIATALEVADRRTLEKDLLAFYLKALHAAGGPALDGDEAWRSYRRSLPTAFAFWTMTLKPTPDFPDMQPPATARVFIERLGAAMADHEVLDAF